MLYGHPCRLRLALIVLSLISILLHHGQGWTPAHGLSSAPACTTTSRRSIAARTPLLTFPTTSSNRTRCTICHISSAKEASSRSTRADYIDTATTTMLLHSFLLLANPPRVHAQPLVPTKGHVLWLGGFQVPAGQYSTYGARLEAAGFAATILEDRNSLNNNSSIADQAKDIVTSIVLPAKVSNQLHR